MPYKIINDKGLIHLMEVIDSGTDNEETKNIVTKTSENGSYEFLEMQSEMMKEFYAYHRKSEDANLSDEAINTEIDAILAKASELGDVAFSSKQGAQILAAHFELQNINLAYEASKKSYSVVVDDSGKKSLFFDRDVELTKDFYLPEQAKLSLGERVSKYRDFIRVNETYKNVNKAHKRDLVKFFQSKARELETTIQNGGLASRDEARLVAAYLDFDNSNLPSSPKDEMVLCTTKTDSSGRKLLFIGDNKVNFFFHKKHKDTNISIKYIATNSEEAPTALKESYKLLKGINPNCLSSEEEVAKLEELLKDSPPKPIMRVQAEFLAAHYENENAKNKSRRTSSVSHASSVRFSPDPEVQH